MSTDLIDFLKELIAFQSVSADSTKRNISQKTAKYISKKHSELGMETQIVENELESKNPIIMSKLIKDPSKPTILCYSHYDVQPASLEDGWDSNPFELVEKQEEGYLYGRGVSDDKGPIAIAYFALKELLAKNISLNICFLYEGEEESASRGFEETVSKNKDFFGKIDGILILDTPWFGDNKPSMNYGLRGIVYKGIEISGPTSDIHSGMGGSIQEPMTDLIHLMSQLISPKGEILIDKFHDRVQTVSDEEIKLYNNVDWTIDDYIKYLGRDILHTKDKIQTLMNMWRFPSLSLHGIEGAFSEPGSKTVIPKRIIGKVSMRLVPDQVPNEISELFDRYVRRKFKELKSSNNLVIHSLGIGDWWMGDINNFLFKAGDKAINDFWKTSASYTRSGGSIPIVPFMEKTFNAPAMALGIGQNSDGAHSQNEHIRIKNLEGGKEVIKIIFEMISQQKFMVSKN